MLNWREPDGRSVALAEYASNMTITRICRYNILSASNDQSIPNQPVHGRSEKQKRTNDKTKAINVHILTCPRDNAAARPRRLDPRTRLDPMSLSCEGVCVMKETTAGLSVDTGMSGSRFLLVLMLRRLLLVLPWRSFRSCALCGGALALAHLQR